MSEQDREAAEKYAANFEGNSVDAKAVARHDFLAGVKYARAEIRQTNEEILERIKLAERDHDKLQKVSSKASREELIRGIVTGFNPDSSQEVLFTRIAEEAYEAATKQMAAAPQAIREDWDNSLFEDIDLITERIGGTYARMLKDKAVSWLQAAGNKDFANFVASRRQLSEVRTELAAERAKCAELVDALEVICNDKGWVEGEQVSGPHKGKSWLEIAREALAKIQGGEVNGAEGDETRNPLP